MKRTFLKVLAILAVGSQVAGAAGTGTGKIAPGWYGYPGGTIFFYLDGPNNGHVNSPCTLIPTRWAIETSTAEGKVAFAQLMLAYARDGTVYIVGFDGVPCAHGNAEIASQIMVY
jgi:hypothetical protein